MLEPLWKPAALAMLEKVENDRSQVNLLHAIRDAEDLICDHPDSREARLEALRLAPGVALWQVPLRVRGDDPDWVLVWWQSDGDAVFEYLGPRPVRR